MSLLKIGVLASGRGSNFQSIMDEIESDQLKAEIVLLITDNPSAFAVERAKKHGVEYLVLQSKKYQSKDDYFMRIAAALKKKNVELVVLAGFMKIVGRPLIDAFRNRIMNIHPALLPSFPGLHGQKQALDYGARISGCTVHFVDEGIDTGPIIIQAAVPVFQNDTEETLSERILKQEHRIYPEAIRLFSEGKIRVEGRKVKIKEYNPADTCVINPSLTEI